MPATPGAAGAPRSSDKTRRPRPRPDPIPSADENGRHGRVDAVRQGLPHPFDTPDLRAMRTPSIRNDPVFGLRYASPPIGSQRLREQVDQRHAAQRQRLLADRPLQFGARRGRDR